MIADRIILVYIYLIPHGIKLGQTFDVNWTYTRCQIAEEAG